MLEYWNYGMVGPMEMGSCCVGKITLKWKLVMCSNEKLSFDPPAADHHSIIPDARQALRSQENPFILNEL